LRQAPLPPQVEPLKAPAGSTWNGSGPMRPQQLPQATSPDAPAIGEPMQTDPSTAYGRYPAVQPARYMEAQGPPPGVQPANYGAMPGQQGSTAQPAVYQAPAPAERYLPAPAMNYQQQSMPYESAPPAYYPAAGQGNVQR